MMAFPAIRDITQCRFVGHESEERCLLVFVKGDSNEKT